LFGGETEKGLAFKKADFVNRFAANYELRKGLAWKFYPPSLLRFGAAYPPSRSRASARWSLPEDLLAS